MATTTTITKMLFRRGNDTDRQQTILASGEPGWTLDTKRLWIGDGITPGGYPALSAADQHLRYVDGSGNIGGGPQKLDLNVGGLSATLVGDGEYARSVHGVDRTINTDHPLQFSTISQTEPAIYYNGDANTEFYINRTNGGTINIGNALYVDIDNSGSGSVRFTTDTTTFEAAKLIFAEADVTVYEDKTLDLNVNVTDGNITPEGTGGTAEKTGLYISHKNYLSAGYMAVGQTGDDTGWSTIELCPPVYENDWTNGETELLNRFDRPASTTSSWTGGGISVGSGLNACKPLVFKSARPAQYTGDADLVFETGLIVYGDGADDIGGWNGYLMNQSVDTGAHPTFTGITIENPDGTPGDPLNVRSGGTGNNSFPPGGVILSHETAPEGKLRSMVLESGEIVTGSDTGAKATKLASNTWMDITSDDTTGVITVTNRMVPTAAFSDANTTQTEYFHKWYNLATNTGNVDPTAYHTNLEIIGDGVDKGASNKSDVNISTSISVGNKVGINHKLHAATLFNANVQNNNLLATFTADSRQAINSITFNKAGHITDIGTMNPGDNYLQLDHVGTEDTRPDGTIVAPDDIIASAASSTPDVDPGITQTDNGHATVVTGIDFNDYGTVRGANTWNLKQTYYNKKEIGDAISLINGSIEDLEEALGSAAFLRSDASTFTTGASMTTSFRNKAKVAFGTTAGSDVTDMSQQDDGFIINTAGAVNVNLPTVTDGSGGNAFSINHGSDVAASFTNTECSLNWDNGWRLRTTATGVEINTECHATSFHGDGTNLDLANNTSIADGDFVKKSTGGTFDGEVRFGDQVIVQPGALPNNEWALTVGGRAFFNDTITTLGDIYAVGDVIAFASSDKRLKENLTPISDPLDKIAQITGYEFDWSDKQKTHKGHDVGVVAQEVEQVLPEVVTDRDDGYKAVRYEKLVPLLIESIKQLTTRVAELESQSK